MAAAGLAAIAAAWRIRHRKMGGARRPAAPLYFTGPGKPPPTSARRVWLGSSAKPPRTSAQRVWLGASPGQGAAHTIPWQSAVAEADAEHSRCSEATHSSHGARTQPPPTSAGRAWLGFSLKKGVGRTRCRSCSASAPGAAAARAFKRTRCRGSAKLSVPQLKTSVRRTGRLPARLWL